MISRTTIKGVLASTALIATAVLSAALPVGAQQPPSDELLFVIAQVDNERPYIGQQITHVTKIYRHKDFPHSVSYQGPDFAGFWNVGETEEEEYSETVNSNVYTVNELRTILFPSIVGTLEIEPAKLTVSDGQSDRPSVVESSSMSIEVLSLPTAPPAGFTGAVGKFEVSAEVDTTSGRMNETVQFTVRVVGSGNIDALPEPLWPSFTGWRVVESPDFSSSEVVDGQLVGSRTYRAILVPEMTGELTVPEINYGFYDADLERYVQASTNPIVVFIAGTDETSPSQSSSVDATGDERDVAVARPIRAVPQPLRPSARELTDNVMYWAAWTLPLLVIVVAAVWRRRRDAWEAALVDSRRRNALPNARSTLARAVSAGADLTVATADAVHTFLSDRFGEPMVGLTREALGERLRDSGVSDELAQRVENTLALGEAARFTPETPATGQSKDYVERATQLLIELDGAIQE